EEIEQDGYETDVEINTRIEKLVKAQEDKEEKEAEIDSVIENYNEVTAKFPKESGAARVATELVTILMGEQGWMQEGDDLEEAITRRKSGLDEIGREGTVGLAQAQVTPIDESAETVNDAIARELGLMPDTSAQIVDEQAAFDNMVEKLKAAYEICAIRGPGYNYESTAETDADIDRLGQLWLEARVEDVGRLEAGDWNMLTGTSDGLTWSVREILLRVETCLGEMLAAQGWNELGQDIDTMLRDRERAKLEQMGADGEQAMDALIPDDIDDSLTEQAEQTGGVVQEGYLFPVDDKDDGIEEDTEDDYFRDVYVRGSITIGEGEITDRGEITAGTEISAEDEAAIIKALVDEVSVVSANIEIAVPDFTPVSLEDVRIIGIVRIMEGDENGARDIDSGGTTDIGLVYADIFDTSSSSTSTGVFFGNSFDIDTRAEADLERLDLALGVMGKLGSTLNIDGDASAGLKLNYSKDELKSSSSAEVDVAALFGAGTTDSVQTNDLETDRESYGINVHAAYEHDLNSFNLGSVKVDAGFTVGANAGVEYYDSQGTFNQLTTGDAGVVGSGEASVAFDDAFDDSGFGVHGGVFAEIGLQLSPEDANLDIDLSFGATVEDLGGGYPVYDQAFSPQGQPSGWDTERVDVTTTYIRIGLEF
ncbi:MAG: hypothetical protein AAGG45_02365, partial [Pseudomonadota bacterium]